ncbi:hypothetical protein B0G82_0803 [Paraburkholderia sp. BL17N1]|nr:hypothetical protein B0G82_0803 [Paraburkholderia sp. BL17N1]
MSTARATQLAAKALDGIDAHGLDLTIEIRW